MKRNVLRANQVLTLPAGVYGDGMGLSLKVGKTGSRSWIYRYRFEGLTKEAGLGSASFVPLAVARAKRDEMLSQLNAGKDPIQLKQETNGLPTFNQAASEFIAAKRPTWKNVKQRVSRILCKRSEC